MSETIKIDPFGFREYDARWLYPKNINNAGIREVGKGFGSQVIKTKKIQGFQLDMIIDLIVKK